jgi:YHS domain-containing protein
MTAQTQKHQFVDPVCGMTVDPGTAAAKTCHDGVQFYFCAQGCKQAFEANPKKFTAKKRKGFWKRYLDRLNKATGGQPPACH